MTFNEALPLLSSGKKVIRSGWGGSEQYIFLVADATYQGAAINPYFLIKTDETPSLSMFQPTSCDLLATDWQIVE
ncbi:DUF2829 domain-containing protein [Loigolactobacillus zhaoyuanensis]|uniref:DUF2829 domain-containing protein n=1 Tax=Loigolactobacillus zhaoyuanensis TaxID=2486017 RepID=A0ABW8U947_9LACO|nr:DUF2829 domain-containing protein [Loigolactobacillus zhaoyuanensis]